MINEYILFKTRGAKRVDKSKMVPGIPMSPATPFMVTPVSTPILIE
jgi:hypothetical protein